MSRKLFLSDVALSRKAAVADTSRAVAMDGAREALYVFTSHKCSRCHGAVIYREIAEGWMANCPDCRVAWGGLLDAPGVSSDDEHDVHGLLKGKSNG
jgi:hypothetical protein